MKWQILSTKGVNVSTSRCENLCRRGHAGKADAGETMKNTGLRGPLPRQGFTGAAPPTAAEYYQKGSARCQGVAGGRGEREVQGGSRQIIRRLVPPPLSPLPLGKRSALARGLLAWRLTDTRNGASRGNIRRVCL